MTLSESQKKHLRGLGHHLKPVVTIADGGLSPGVMNEFETQIGHHELVKVRVRVGDREARDAVIAQLCQDTRAELVTRIGNVALLFRRNAEKPRVQLPRS